ncbi:hypothetical protein TNIN_419361 [Trichonephila inaurata madagascariensis]|uniref:Uncharacterized protein n=1 Tax=Trichonephila inaurata madagascariensis TaxID=2747483 RepID=A0A8X6XX61_9ARAC|nr:hypothetical protein TNIN_419361 [Trichonephila inaurata madagascariensis]
MLYCRLYPVSEEVEELIQRPRNPLTQSKVLWNNPYLLCEGSKSAEGGALHGVFQGANVTARGPQYHIVIKEEAKKLLGPFEWLSLGRLSCC